MPYPRSLGDPRAAVALARRGWYEEFVANPTLRDLLLPWCSRIPFIITDQTKGSSTITGKKASVRVCALTGERWAMAYVTALDPD
jgi:hypothetical protein